MKLAKQDDVKDKLLTLLLTKQGIAKSQNDSFVRRSETGSAPLSYSQQRLWFLDQLNGSSSEYNMPEVLRLRGELDLEAFSEAIHSIVARHEILRTYFDEVNGAAVQVIIPSLRIDLPLEDLSALDEARRQQAVIATRRCEREKPFDLRQGPLLRVKLLRLAPRDHLLLLTFHHIVWDAVSAGVFSRELSAFYRAFRNGGQNPFRPLDVQYADFAVWQRNHLERERMSQGLEYWRKQLAGLPDQVTLPTDRPRPPVQTFAAETLTISIPDEDVLKLKEFGYANQATLYMTLLSGFAILLQRHSGQNDIVLGSPIANRSAPQIEQMIGFFVNSLVMRVRLNTRATFRELLSDVRRACLDAYAHQEIPFERLVEELAPQRSLNTTPIFQVVFALQNASTSTQTLEGLEVEPLPGDEFLIRHDLEVHAIEGNGGLDIYWVFNSDLFDRSRINQLARHFVALLEAAVKAPDLPLHRMQMLSHEERTSLLETFNSPGLAPSASTVPQLFEEQVDRNPDAIALVCGDQSLTYRELNMRANRLANRLKSLGVGPEILVGIALERSVEMIMALVAILKAGGAYLPFDENLPAGRRSSLLASGRVRYLVTLEQSRRIFQDLVDHIVTLDGDERKFVAESESSPVVPVSCEHAAYVNYTSGSTGEPKGVLVPHRAIVRLVRKPNYVQLEATSRILQLAPLSFDAATLEIWGALLNGGTLVIMSPGPVSTEEISAVVVEQGIDTLWLTAGLFNQFVDSALSVLAGVRQMLTGGDVLSVEHVEKFRRAHPGCKLVNGYGPTENTTFSCCHRVSPEENLSRGVPIGSPINGTRVYLLDADMQPVPVGAVGEVYAAGAGLARGYLNRPGLTAERFLPDPYGRASGDRMYRTGDLACRRADGILEFLGRTDRQVKIRGFRIELGEIEAILRGVPGVQDTIVITREDEIGKQLVAYLVPQPGACLNLAEVREYLGGQLPTYMCPSGFAVIPALPLNANGKVDREALPAPTAVAQEAYVAPQLPDEELLARIWAQVLQVGKVGRHDNFFERGGHSLLATQLVSRIRNCFDTPVTLRLLFDNPTLMQFARALRAQRRTQTDPAPPLEPILRDGDEPLSFAQQRLWFLHQLEPENPFYNVPLGLRLKGSLDVRAMHKALSQLIQRHETLRTNFRAHNGGCVQVIRRSADMPLAVLDLTGLPVDQQEAEVARLSEADARKPFDLSSELLIRAQLLQLRSDLYVLLLSMHHIVSDGWSIGVLTHELSELYNAARAGRDPILPALPIQYADFAQWQRKWLSGEVLNHQLAYWKRQLADAPPELRLPTDRPRPAVQSFRGQLETIEIEPKLADDLRSLSNESGATLFMTLLTGFAVLIARYSNQWDMVIGSPIANRTRSELERLIGFFVNTLALRLRFDGGQTFREVLRQTRQVALDAYAHQDLPFERLVDELQTERDLSRNPIFQVMFALQNAPLGEREFVGLTIDPIKATAVAAQFDLVLDVWETQRSLTCVLEYSTDLFDRETALRLLGHYRNLLAKMVSDVDQSISSITFIDTEERLCLLDRFNSIQKNYPTKWTLHELFEEQVALAPRRLAVVDQYSQLTYTDLNTKANRIADLLREICMPGGEHVGILDDRGCDFMASMLGTLKAGCSFLPLDPAYPEERLRYMISDSQISTLITRRSTAEKHGLTLHTGNVQYVIVLDGEASSGGMSDALRWYGKAELDRASPENSQRQSASTDVAYLLYTSGSTGSPKGALVRHDGAINHIFAEFELLSFHQDSAFLQSAPCSSDISVWQFLAPALIGGRVVVADFETVCDPERLFGWIRDRAVTVIELVPVVLGELLEHARSLPPHERELPDLEVAIVTGETVSVALINAWLELYPSVPIVNAFGPTEAADDVCQHSVTKPLPPNAPNVPIGRPLPNVWLYVLDDALHLAPIGVPGEICVSGIAVGDGYWNDPARTKERFVPNPYGPEDRGQTLYRTGDLGRWMPNGVLEYLGRCDNQVKLRGFRIELGEIESVLSQHPAVREAVVVARASDTAEKSLTAYIVPQLTAAASDRLACFQEEQIALWSSLHDDSYAVEKSADPTFNCVGWDSNYTGQPLPEADMREYVKTAVDRILSLQPRRVLEIGCGTGLLAFELIQRCQEYFGIDSSQTAIKQLQMLQRSESLRERVPGFDRATFVCCRADRIADLGFSPDVAILPSVVQYFPSLDYCEKVLRTLVDTLALNGCIFIGDVRDLQLLEAFHTSVQLFKAEPDLPVLELRRRIERSIAHEQELCVHKAWFLSLLRRIPKITSVEILPKPGRCSNEMTRFRYDVVIRLGQEVVRGSEPDWIEADRFLWEDFTAAVRRGERSCVAIRRVPNARVQDALSMVASLLRSEANCVVSELTGNVSSISTAGLDPQDFLEFASAHDYLAEIGLSSDGEPGSFDVILAPSEWTNARQFCQSLGNTSGPQSVLPWSDSANCPLLEKIGREWTPEFRAFLKARVPGHMVPSNFVLLDRMPLGPAGKIDRVRLPQPRSERALGLDGSELESNQERALAAIWCAVLELDAVGRRDNFFELGGHSLKATQVVSRIRKEMGLSISLREVFNNPTICEFAPLLDQAVDSDSAGIPRVPQAEDYPLSHAQKRLWILHRMDPESSAYNMPSGVMLQGELNRKSFERALQLLLRRHESLRTVVRMVDGVPRQRVLPEMDADLSFVDLRRQPEPLEIAKRLAIEQAQAPFDLERGPLFRLKMLQVDDDRYVFLSTLHHIISDDWSGDLMVRELREAYTSLATGMEPSLEPLRIQYRDYAAWQNALLADDSIIEHRNYWLAQFDGDLPVLDLPIDRPRPSLKTFCGASVRFQWDQTFSDRLREFGRQHGASLFMTLAATVITLLHRYTGQRDIILGSPVAGRTNADLEAQIGFYVNTLALRHRPVPEMTFAALLEQVVQVITGALDHQIYPFDKLVNELNLRRDVSRSPLFDVMLVLQNGHKDWQWPGLKLTPFECEFATTQFDLTISFEPSAYGLGGEIKFNTDLFERSHIERMVDHLRMIATSALIRPATRLDRLPMVTPAELSQLCGSPRQISTTLVAGVVDRFEAQVAQTPEAIALTYGEVGLSYQELNRRANQLAWRLKKLGVMPSDRVGLFLPRSADMIVGLIGILKAGAAYVPLDIDCPPDRLAFIVADSEIAVLVTDLDAFASELASLPPGVPKVNAADPSLAEESIQNLAERPLLSDVAYVIYTSGSTGQPKGVPVTHANLIRLFEVSQPLFQFDANDVWTLFHSIAFDFSVWELWGALLFGGRLVVIPFWTARSPAEFLTLLAKERVTVLNQTPAAFRQLIRVEREAGAKAPELALRYVIFGGEALEPRSLRSWFQRHGDQKPRLINMYGITETTVHVTFRPLSKTEVSSNASPIGEPLADLQIYLFDRHLEPVPVGLPGEIHVGGGGVALGYLNRPGLTAERFIPNPYASEAGARLYRSGDIARRLPNGELEYLGRVDQQVKVRGFRVELGEVESHLLTHPAIHEAVVRPVQHAGEMRLAAWLVLRTDCSVLPTELRAFLRPRIPEYMVPGSFTFLKTLPLTVHGKLDSRALPPPVELPTEVDGRRLPKTEIESMLAAIWTELLGVEHVDLDQNIFDLGAHSLLIVQVQERLREQGWEVTVLDVFRYPTVQQLAAHLAGKVDHIDSSLAASEDRAVRQRGAREMRAKLHAR
jgi:amino acid adenylation domain-containing protein